ncbi:c-type cytochrome [Oleiagrimonas sp. C23AA]|uniref:c-type cytochrome n=1 Tax=Oleiagrimonas sp. C23AA TaxID=2719047 RepID=UPI00141E8103|nr:c-type cytochrome [Oleiagrimonas sp. C23AA]NII11890.1 cytochrome C [Oleiagrimonas sp. C23AA]
MTRIYLVAAALLAFSAPVWATLPAKPPQLGLCAACHGEHGQARVPGAPNLAAQKYDYLMHALKQYKNGQRDVPVMRAAIGPMSQAQLEALARWYAAQPGAAAQETP